MSAMERKRGIIRAYPMRLRLALVACVLCLTTRPRSGHAEEAREVRLRYAAPAECPTADDFAAEVRARTALARISAGAGPDTTLDVHIKNVEGGSAGTIRLYTDVGATTPREVKAATCVQVVSALALMAALAIDPEASTEPAPEPKVQEKPAPPPPAPVVPARIVPPAASARFRWKAGVALEALDGVTPDVVLGVRPFFEMVREGPSPWGFAARLSGAYARGTAPRIAEGSGEFTVWALRLEGCPLHYRPWAPLWLSSCLTLDGGELDAAGKDVAPAAEVRRAWVTGGVSGRLEIRLFDLLSLELGGGVLFPFVRDRFYLGTGATLYRTPAVAGAGGLGLGALFP